MLFLGAYYDNLKVKRTGVTSVNWPKPKLKFSLNKKVSCSLHHHAYRDLIAGRPTACAPGSACTWHLIPLPAVIRR